MALSRWKKLSEDILFKNPWWTYKRDAFELASGERGEYHYVFTGGASLVLPFGDDGRLVMVRQYRYLCDRESLEFPCGGVKSGSSYEQTAAHELAEETGLAAERLESIGEFNPYNGVTNEICRVFLARGLRQVPQHPDATEEFEQLLLTPTELEEHIRSGSVWDGMTLAAWSLARSRFL